MTSKRNSSKGLIDWACEVEGNVLAGDYSLEKPPLIFIHWLAVFILLVYSLLYRLGLVSE